MKGLEKAEFSPQALEAVNEWNKAVRMFKWGSRTVAFLAVATAGYEIYTSENKVKTVTKQVAGFAAGTYCGGVCAGVTVETGPGALVAGALGFAFGYFVGSEVTEQVYQMTFERGVKIK